MFCFPSGKHEPIGVPVPGKGAGSLRASTHPQEQKQQQKARSVHGAAGGTCPHRPLPAAAIGFQFSPLRGRIGLRGAALLRPPPRAGRGSARSGCGREGLREASAAAPPPPRPARPPPEPRPPAPPTQGGEGRGGAGRARGEPRPRALLPLLRALAFRASPQPCPGIHCPARANARPSRMLWARGPGRPHCGSPQCSLSYPSLSASGFSFFLGALLPTQPLSARMSTARPARHLLLRTPLLPLPLPGVGGSLCKGVGRGRGAGGLTPTVCSQDVQGRVHPDII